MSNEIENDTAQVALESIKVAKAATVQAMAAIECTAQAMAAKWARQARMALQLAEMSNKTRMGNQGVYTPKKTLEM